MCHLYQNLTKLPEVQTDVDCWPLCKFIQFFFVGSIIIHIFETASRRYFRSKIKEKMFFSLCFTHLFVSLPQKGVGLVMYLLRFLEVYLSLKLSNTLIANVL